MNTVLRILLPLLSAVIYGSPVAACPRVAGLPDLNCDGSAAIAVLGDSLVYGIGDSIHGNRGGYVLRAQDRFPQATFYNLGQGGNRAKRLVRELGEAFKGSSNTALATHLKGSDVVFLDLGRNDWWDFKPALATWRDLKRCREIIQNNITATTGHAPLVITAQMVLANRTGQGTWVLDLNNIIKQKSSSVAPGDLRFNVMSKRLLADRVHPTPAGYDVLTKILVSYLQDTLPRHAKSFRSDSDGDGLYDEFEQEKFGTDPHNADTDGDGTEDGRDRA